MNRKVLLCFTSLMLAADGLSQRQCVVVDLETGVPVRDVVLAQRGQTIARSQWDGTLLLPDTLATVDTTQLLSLSHAYYEQRMMCLREWTDTIGLIRCINALREVVVTGQMKWKEKSQAFQVPVAELKALDQASGKSGFSPGEMKRLAKKRKLKRLKELLSHY